MEVEFFFYEYVQGLTSVHFLKPRPETDNCEEGRLRVASHADVLKGSSRIPASRTSAEPKDKFLSHCAQISAGDHMQIIENPIGAVEVKVLTSQTHTYKLDRE